MPHWRMTGMTMIAGLMAVLLLGRLPALERDTQDRRAQTAAAAPQFWLSDATLADAMAGLPFKERLTRVGWDHSIVTVDLTLRSNRQSLRPLLRDVAQLIRFSFGDAANVRRVLFRVYQETGGRRTLLLYGDGRRQDWTMEDIAAMRLDTVSANDDLWRKCRFATTDAGERWLRHLAN